MNYEVFLDGQSIGTSDNLEDILLFAAITAKNFPNVVITWSVI